VSVPEWEERYRQRYYKSVGADPKMWPIMRAFFKTAFVIHKRLVVPPGRLHELVRAGFLPKTIEHN
jgi:hypothetical protein